MKNNKNNSQSIHKLKDQNHSPNLSSLPKPPNKSNRLIYSNYHNNFKICRIKLQNRPTSFMTEEWSPSREYNIYWLFTISQFVFLVAAPAVLLSKTAI